MQIQHVLVNCFHAFISITVQLLVPLPPVLFGEAFLHISQTTLWKDEIEKRTLRRYMENNQQYNNS